MKRNIYSTDKFKHFIIQRNRDDNEKLGTSKVSNIMYLKLAVNFGIELMGLRLYEYLTVIILSISST